MHRIARAIDADAFCAGPTGPDTGLYVGAGLSCNITDAVCTPLWEHVWEQEFLVPDYNKFADLTAADPVADLRQATGGKLSRSARYRTLNAVADLEDELRAVLHAGGRSWGKLQLNRHTGAEPFTEADRAFLRAAAPLAGAVLRRAMLKEPAHTDTTRGPGVLVVSEAGTVISATAEADAWLQELTAGYREHSTYIGIHPELLLMPLRALTEPGVPSLRIRLRTLSGTWLAAHASSLAGSGHVAIVIEPAKASEIASTLFLSRHTVRDHLKAIFQKVGVSSRGELTSKLFAEHDHGPLNHAISASADRVRANLELARERA